MRKFSVQCFSYIFSTLSVEDFADLFKESVAYFARDQSMKRTELNKLIEATWLDLDCPVILYKLKRARVDNDLIVTLRLSSLIKFDVSDDFCKELAKQCKGQYEWFMRELLGDMGRGSKAESKD
jgi:hypothetical protein